GGELLARCLANEGVRFVFGLPSPEIDPLLAQLSAQDIRLVPVRHEAAGVHMAEGLYKTAGQVAVVIGNPGPGSANLLPGVITARHEGVPVLALRSQHRLGIVYPSPRRRRFRGRINSMCSGPWLSGTGPFCLGSASQKSCAWPSAKCGPDGRARCTSSCRRQCCM